MLDTVEKFNYRTNIVAKSLRTSKSQSIGIIVPDITNEFFANIVLAIENYCFPRGYSVFVCNTSEDEDKEEMYIRDLEAKCVDGLIYLFGRLDVPLDIIRRRLPVVCIDRNPNNKKDIVVIESDNYGGGFLATETLIRKGCKRIVLLRDYRNISTVIQRASGYMDALGEHGLPLDSELVRNIEVNVKAASEAISDLIEKGVAFDGVFALTDWMAVGALMALKKHRIKVPGQVKVIGFDNISIAEYSSPALTTINQDKKKLGETAAQIILDTIDGKTIECKSIVVPVELVERETT